MRMGTALVLALALLCSTGLAWGSNLTDSELQIPFKVFAQNEEAFTIFMQLVPAPTEAIMKQLYAIWLAANPGQKRSWELVRYPDLSAAAAKFPDIAAAALPFIGRLCNCSRTPPPSMPIPITSSPAITQAPASSTKVPATTTKTPVIITQAPGITTRAPVTSTQAAATTTQAPPTSTKAPVATTQAAATTTQAPATSTMAPAITTQAAAITTQAPVTTTQAAASTTQASATSTKAPDTTKQAAASTTQASATSTKAPDTTTQAAAATTQAPPTSTKMPVSTTQAAATTTQAPSTSTKGPDTTTQAAATTTQAPPTSTKMPASTTQAFATTTQGPVTSTKSPVTTTQAAATTTQAPATSTKAPIATTQAPVTSTMAPVTTTQAPATSTKAPVTSTMAPVTTTQAPATSTKAPVTTTQALITTTQAPVTTTKAPATTEAGHGHKKGAGMVSWGQVNKALANAQLSWVYNWKVQPDSGTNLPGGTTFVPLIYSKNDATTANFNTAKKSGSGVVLAFNEPNEPAKGDTTVAEAITAWPLFQASGLRLGSPALSVYLQDGRRNDSWIYQFVEQIDAKNYLLDFMTVHWYGNSSVWNNIDGAVELFQEYCQGYHDIYQRPLWVTEFGLADYGNATNGYNGYFPSTDLQVEFMNKAVPMLDSLSYVERYAWTYLGPDDVYQGDTESLYNLDGSPTPVGTAYRSF